MTDWRLIKMPQASSEVDLSIADTGTEGLVLASELSLKVADALVIENIMTTY